MISFFGLDVLNPKLSNSISKYVSLSKYQSLTVGIYREGKFYVYSNQDNATQLCYDIGSISKTITAHLILYLADKNLLKLCDSVSKYIDLPNDNYPTIYELLTHTSGYNYLTPLEITVPALLRHGYAKRNVYQNCSSKTVVNCLKKRKKQTKKGYSYSDFSYAILAVVAEKVTGKRFSHLIEEFVQNELGMKSTAVRAPSNRMPLSVYNKKIIDFWKWEEDNPYIASGGLVSNVYDMLIYISHQIDSQKPYIVSAHEVCEKTISSKSKSVGCVGWHTYKKSNQLWHVGSVGTFQSSIIINKKRKLGVVVFGNSKGVPRANVHYIIKMLYDGAKKNKINFKEQQQ